MPFIDFLAKDEIQLNFEAANKEAALKSLCLLAAKSIKLPFEHIHEVVLEREQMGSTGVGDGVALPHGKSRLLRKPFILAARSPKGIDFESIDSAPARIFILVLTPLEGNLKEHLQILARLGRFFSSPENISALMNAPTQEVFYNLLVERDKV